MEAPRFTLTESEIPCRGMRLYCSVARPAAPAVARVVIVHGYGEHATRYMPFMQYLAEQGVASAIIDQRGHGRSPGRRGYVRHWEEYLDDLQALLRCPEFSLDAPLFVMGHSHGSLISAAAGERGILGEAGVVGCVLASPYFATRIAVPGWKLILARMAHRLLPALQVPRDMGSALMTTDSTMAAQDRVDPLMHYIATPRWYFTMRQAQAQVMRDAPLFTLPLLCLIGQSDVVADPAIAEEFVRRSGSQDKSFYAYPNRVHELFREVDREKVFGHVTKWILARTA